MKTIRTLTTGALLSAVFFTACNKEEYAAAPDNSTSTAPLSKAAPEHSILSFSGGYSSASYLSLTENDKVIYQNGKSRQIELFNTFANYDPYANIYGTHYNFGISIKASSPRDGLHSLQLKGHGFDGASDRPVIFQIDRPIFMTGTRDKINISDATNFITMMNMNPDNLSKSITSDMLLRAQKRDGTIIISETMNVDLYKIILTNLNTMISVQFN